MKRREFFSMLGAAAVLPIALPDRDASARDAPPADFFEARDRVKAAVRQAHDLCPAGQTSWSWDSPGCLVSLRWPQS